MTTAHFHTSTSMGHAHTVMPAAARVAVLTIAPLALVALSLWVFTLAVGTGWGTRALGIMLLAMPCTALWLWTVNQTGRIRTYIAAQVFLPAALAVFVACLVGLAADAFSGALAALLVLYACVEWYDTLKHANPRNRPETWWAQPARFQLLWLAAVVVGGAAAAFAGAVHPWLGGFTWLATSSTIIVGATLTIWALHVLVGFSPILARPGP